MRYLPLLLVITFTSPLAHSDEITTVDAHFQDVYIVEGTNAYYVK